jgi:hypothetical protein
MTPEPCSEKGQQLTRWLEDVERNLNLFRHTFPWAIEKAKERYSAYHKRNNGLTDMKHLNVTQASLRNANTEWRNKIAATNRSATRDDLGN